MSRSDSSDKIEYIDEDMSSSSKALPWFCCWMWDFSLTRELTSP